MDQAQTNAMASLAALMLAIGVSGCAAYSPESYDAERRQELLRLYPPGKTTRQDVRDRWGPNHSREFPRYAAATRPAGGWETGEYKLAGPRALQSQARTGQPVASVERYYGPDGRRFPFGLCYVWYYYDEHDRLIDVEWQYASD